MKVQSSQGENLENLSRSNAVVVLSKLRETRCNAFVCLVKYMQ